MRIIDVTYPFLVSVVIYLYLKVQHHDTVIVKIDTKLVLNDAEDTQERNIIEREPYWQKELLKNNANGKNTNTQVNEDLELVSLDRKRRRLNSNSYEGNYNIDTKLTSETAMDRRGSGMVDDDDSANDVASDNNTNNFVFSIAEDLLQSLQSFVCSVGEIVPYGDTFFDGCNGETDEDGNSTINTDEDDEDNNDTSTDAANNTDDVSNNNDMVDDDDYDNMASDDDKNVIDMDDDDNAVFEEIQNDSNISSPVSENDNSSSDGLIDNDENDDYNISTNTTYINDDKISTEYDGSYNSMVDDDDYNNINNSVIADEFGYDYYNTSTNATTYRIDDEVLSSNMTDDYDDYYNKTLENSTNENDLYYTSCVLTKADIPLPCDDYGYFYWCDYAFRCTDTSDFPYDYDYDITWQNFMLQTCPKTCDACPSPISLLENQIKHEEDENVITTFNISLNVNTDSYANETLWLLASRDNKDYIFNSSKTNSTSQLANNEEYVIQYNCIISQNVEREDQLYDDKTATSTCYDFEVHDTFGDGICCEYGDGSFSMNVTTKSTTLEISDDFKDGIFMSSSFCINHDDGEIENKGTHIKNEPSHYPFKRWQCKNGECLCDLKPGLASNTLEYLTFMLEVTMLSDSDKLRDVDSAQYKAACWVLYDDLYKYDLEDKGAHKRMMQRYILAVLYFATSPKEWGSHRHFLSSRSECGWYHDHEYHHGWKYGISCNEDDIVISIDLTRNNLGGTIVEELSGLRMLEALDLYGNNIHGTVPAVLGRLSQLRYLHLGWNDLEGTIPPQLLDATNLEGLMLFKNQLEGTIPDTIGNLQKLYWLHLSENSLSGSIPDAIYTLKNLNWLSSYDNKLSSSISMLIGNLKKLNELHLNNNMLTGQIPSTIGSLSSLGQLYLFNNKFSGSIPSTMGNMKSLDTLDLSNNTLSERIPESLFDLPLKRLYLQDNSVTGSVPDEFCDRVGDDNIEADCQNDVFDPKVRCSCCLCKDESPTWDGKYGEAIIKVIIDHDYDYNSNELEWSLTYDATGKKVLHDGPYGWEDGLHSSYEACVAYSDCLSFNQISPPHRNTNYQIYWNDNSIYNGTIGGLREDKVVCPGTSPGEYCDCGGDCYNEPDWCSCAEAISCCSRDVETLVTFQYNEEKKQVTSCYQIEYACGYDVINLRPNTTERIMYDQATTISGKDIINDNSSPQSKALCWLVNNNRYDNKSDTSDTDIIQRYVLSILHFMSPYGLFGNDENLAEKHECEWNGITCKDNNTEIVTSISLSSENNQIINGTLINEIGSLKYLEVLELNQTKLHGTIPRSFSNLWSLTKLDLSDNKISSTIPGTLFRQLNKLEYIDLSNNKLSGSINDDIGSFSHIRTLLLRNNLLTGSLSLEGFKHYDLEHLDVSENELSGIDFSLLLKHNNMKFLDVSSNFFVGSILDHTFTSLTHLRHFNISQNDFSGTIPSTFPVISNITRIDIHSNRFKGPIPLSISELKNIQHINLQGNKLTGSLPSQLNKLKSLDTLILSHNELKGLIPFNTTALQNMKRLHLHSNKLSGKAPEFKNLTSYISDCGFPSDSLEPVSCSTCNTCCSSDGVCLSKTSENLSQVQLTVIFVVSIIIFILICYMMKDYITSNKYLESFFSETVFFWNAMVLISDKSVYHFLLAKNKTEWFVAVCCVVFQTATLFLFVHSADLTNAISDREYTMTCPANSLECEDSNTVSSYGLFVFGLILTIWLLKDIIGSVKLMLVSFQKRSIDFFFASAVIFTVTMLSIWTSVIYIIAIATKNTDMIKDAVVLLFVVEVDERIFQLVETINPEWIEAIDNNMRGSLIYRGDDLVITSWAQKSAKSMESMRKKIRERGESFRKRRSKESDKREVKEKDEGGKTSSDAAGVESNYL